jgi:hypothetical protein
MRAAYDVDQSVHRQSDPGGRSFEQHRAGEE